MLTNKRAWKHHLSAVHITPGKVYGRLGETLRVKGMKNATLSNLQLNNISQTKAPDHLGMTVVAKRMKGGGRKKELFCRNSCVDLWLQV